jgi:hypothetical protein
MSSTVVLRLDVTKSKAANVRNFWTWWDSSYGARGRMKHATARVMAFMNQSTRHFEIVQAISVCPRMSSVMLLDDETAASVDVVELSMFANVLVGMVWAEHMAEGRIYRPASVSMSVRDTVRVCAKRSREDLDSSVASDDERAPPGTQPMGFPIFEPFTAADFMLAGAHLLPDDHLPNTNVQVVDEEIVVIHE